jgi:hypothetical protein
MAATSFENGQQWDIFIAHASPDQSAAEELYGYLAKFEHPRKLRIFLDTKSLRLGDDWDTNIAAAQRNSKVTVALVSSKTEGAFYQREEIAAAIALARKDKTNHRVVPIYLDDHAASDAKVPYGLRLKHGISLSEAGSLEAVASRLEDLVEDLDNIPAAVLEKRAELLSVDSGGEVSLQSVTRATSKAAAAVHTFADSLVDIARSGLRIVDLFKDRQERARLKRILGELYIIENYQAPVPWLLRLYADRHEKGEIRDGHDNWGQVTDMIAYLTPAVAQLTELLAAEHGNFMIQAQDAYKSLLFSLKERMVVYKEIEKLQRPKSPEDIACLRTLADKYDQMIDDVKRGEKAIGLFLKE